MVSRRAGAFREAGFFLGLALVLTLLFDRSFPIDSDEGYSLGAAWQLWNGLRMYDDFRLFVGPGCGYAVFWLWKLLGAASHSAATLLAVGFSFSSTIALYLLLKRLGVRAMILALAVILWLFACAFYVPLNHNSFSSYAALWFLLPLSSLLRPVAAAPGARAAGGSAALAGLAAAVVFVFLPTKGALLAAAAGALLFSAGLRRRAFRPTLVFVASFSALVALLCLRWRPGTLVEQWLLIPLRNDYLGHTGASRGVLVLAVALVGAMIVAAVRVRDRLLTMLAIVQAALFASMTHNMEPHHLAINAFPAIVCAAVVVQRGLSPTSRLLAFPVEAALATAVATVVGWMVFSSVGAGFFAQSALSVDVLGHRARILESPRLDAAHAIYAGPFLPGLYYLLGKKNPFFVSESVVCDDACQVRLVRELEAVRPELAFLNYAMVEHLSYDEDAPVDSYLRAHYIRCPGRGVFVVRALDPSWCP